MIAFLAVMGICGAAVGGYALVTKMEHNRQVPRLPNGGRPKVKSRYPWVFPTENTEDERTISDILLYLMATEDGVPEDWMRDVRRVEGDSIRDEGIYHQFWETFKELNKKFQQFDRAVDEYIRKEHSLSESASSLYKESMYHLKMEIYELAYACYEIMIENEQDESDEPATQLATTDEEEIPLSVEQQKLLAIYRSKDSTPEMKQESLELLKELEKMNPDKYTNPKLNDMEMDIETIRRIVKGKQT